MDFSSDYITMCSKAKEVQEQWQPDRGDFVVHSGGIYVLFYCGSSLMFDVGTIYDRFLDVNEVYFKLVSKHKDQLVWLPRQDQLQKFLNVTQDLPGYILEEIVNFIYSHKCGIKKCISGEKLWLMYVMYKRFYKVWDSTDEDWVLYIDHDEV